MKTFLQKTAKDIYTKHQAHLNELSIVFPNKRARLFFMEYLSNEAGKPLWMPQFISISELFCQNSSLSIADPLLLNGLLYTVFQKVCHRNATACGQESFDEFYTWGSILLGDFDNIDKNNVDARQLFRNISQQESYNDDLSHLNQEQIETIQRFFQHFNPREKSELKERFIRTWNCIADVYADFRELLLSKGLAYEGLLYRLVSEDSDADAFKDAHYIFVGFNALNECEKKLFRKLHRAGKASFYWDYDEFYLNNAQHEAGRFLRENLKEFPNELDKSHFRSFSEIPKRLHFISSPTENAQGHYVGNWVSQTMPPYLQTESALVLCNENLLLPVLHSLPDSVRDLNVTMGYPVTQTTVFSLIRQIVLLHTDDKSDSKTGTAKNARCKFVLPILQHPLVRKTCPEAQVLGKNIQKARRFRVEWRELQQNDFLKLIFTPIDTPQALGLLLMNFLKVLAQKETETSETVVAEEVDKSAEEIFRPLYQESIFRCYTQISRLNDILNEGMFSVNLPTYKRLLQKALNISVPFSGEPVQGLQIMGILETRNLNFKNVLLLSVNEKILPKKNTSTSFIPYNLQRAFGLTGQEHQDAISAYYFFRFIQRAENITLIYSNVGETLNSGEMSRFMLQLMMESPLSIERFHLNSSNYSPRKNEICIEKSAAIQMELQKYIQGEKLLSPTAINSWLSCPLKFYFHYIKGMKAEEELSEQVDGLNFGNIFHQSVEQLYTELLQEKNPEQEDRSNPRYKRMLQVEDIESLIRDKERIQSTVDHFFRLDFFHITQDEALEYNGQQLIQRNLIIRFIGFLLRMDKAHAPFELLEMEKESSLTLTIPSAGGSFPLKVCGRIDRIDRKEGRVRILDYKTGGKPESFTDIEALFQPDKDRMPYIVQILLYALAEQQKYPQQNIMPAILYIHQAAKEDYQPDIKMGASGKQHSITNISEIASSFQEALERSLAELFDVSIPFSQTKNNNSCQYCDFKGICQG